MTTATAAPTSAASGPSSAFKAPPRPPLRLRGPVLFGAAVVGLFVVGLGTWAAVAEVAGAVTAPGALVVESNRKIVQHLEGGIVAEILVREGAQVRAGDPLVRLDDTKARASARLLANQIAAQEALAARLAAERDDAAAIVFPASLRDAATTLPEAAEAMAVQQRVFEERRASRLGQIEILQSRISQLAQQREGLATEKAAGEKQLALFGDEVNGLRELFAQGHTSRTRILAIEREMAELEGTIGRLVSTMAQADQKAGETRLEILQLSQRFREEVVAELRDVQVDLGNLYERKAVADDVLRRTVVPAPQDGVVQALTLHTVGGVVEPGKPLMEIVPATDRLLIDARLSPMDIENVTAGQIAEVRFVGLHDRTLPVIEASVSRVSADRLTASDGETAYYATRLDLPEDEFAKLGEHRVQAGMPVEVFIRTSDRTVLDYFVEPLTGVLDRAFAVE